MKLTRKTYETRPEKTKDFIIGFVGWFIVNILLFACQALIAFGSREFIATQSFNGDTVGLLGTAVSCIAFLINIGGIIYLAFTRHWIALGALAAFGALLAITVLLAIFFLIACFVLIWTGTF